MSADQKKYVVVRLNTQTAASEYFTGLDPSGARRWAAQRELASELSWDDAKWICGGSQGLTSVYAIEGADRDG